jgi:hypothetical protein
MAESGETLRNWRGLYEAALFESDPSKMPSRVEEARNALVFRSRELFATSPLSKITPPLRNFNRSVPRRYKHSELSKTAA